MKASSVLMTSLVLGACSTLTPTASVRIPIEQVEREPSWDWALHNSMYKVWQEKMDIYRLCSTYLPGLTPLPSRTYLMCIRTLAPPEPYP